MPTEKYGDLPISGELRKAVQDVGFEAMTPIQAKAIPLIQRAHAKGVFHKNTTSRKISNLTRAVNSLK